MSWPPPRAQSSLRRRNRSRLRPRRGDPLPAGGAGQEPISPRVSTGTASSRPWQRSQGTPEAGTPRPADSFPAGRHSSARGEVACPPGGTPRGHTHSGTGCLPSRSRSRGRWAETSSWRGREREAQNLLCSTRPPRRDASSRRREPWTRPHVGGHARPPPGSTEGPLLPGARAHPAAVTDQRQRTGGRPGATPVGGHCHGWAGSCVCGACAALTTGAGAGGAGRTAGTPPHSQVDEQVADGQEAFHQVRVHDVRVHRHLRGAGTEPHRPTQGGPPREPAVSE